MTTNPNPMTAPLIIASLSIGASPSEEMKQVMIGLIDAHGEHFTAAESNSIMTAAERLGDHALMSDLADALIRAQGNPIE